MSNVIPFDEPKEAPKQEPKCSFCDRPESQVQKLLSNNIDKHICNKCVVKAKQRLEQAA